MDNLKAAASAAKGAAETVAATVADAAKDVARDAAAVVGGTVAAVGEKLGTPEAPLPLPDDRPQLMALHREARSRRDAAPLMSKERADAVRDLERIEVHVARIERAMDPPLV
jgi:hypothetical protein